MTIPLGFDAAIYYQYDSAGDSGDYITPKLNGTVYNIDFNTAATGIPVSTDFTLLDIVTDVTVDMSKGEADITNRSTDGFRAVRGTLKEGNVSFELMWDTGDAKFQDFFGAYYNNYPICMAILDGEWSATAGAQGLYASFDVISFEKSEPLEDAQKVSVTSKVTIDGVVTPQWVVTIDTT